MKITIEFDTSDPEQDLEYKQVMAAKSALSALYHASKEIRETIQYESIRDTGQSLTGFEVSGMNYAHIILMQAMEENGINLERLYP